MDGDAVHALAGRFSKPIELGELVAAPTDWRMVDPKSLIAAGPAAEALAVYTLGAVRDYIKANRDTLDRAKLVVHVVSPQIVRLVGPLQDRARNREAYINATALNLTDGFLGKFLAIDEFIIGLQTRFKRNDEALALLKLFGNVTHETARTSADDGITQTVTAKTGIALKADATVPNPIALVPYRTFREVVQPPSLFALRVTGGNGGLLTVGMFEADGGAWRLAAIEAIGVWLTQELEGSNVEVIA